MTRPDSYILKLEKVERNLQMQIMHCRKSLTMLEDIKIDDNYTDSASALEKNNIDALIELITNGLSVLEAIVWE